MEIPKYAVPGRDTNIDHPIILPNVCPPTFVAQKHRSKQGFNESKQKYIKLIATLQ